MVRLYDCELFACLVLFAEPGLGEKRDYDEVVSEVKLRASRKKENRNLIAGLREENHSGVLLEHCKKDYKEGRMECPRLAHECDLTAITLSPRLVVEQGEHCSLVVCFRKCPHGCVCVGLKPDGTVKVRPIDDMSTCPFELVRDVHLRLVAWFCQGGMQRSNGSGRETEV